MFLHIPKTNLIRSVIRLEMLQQNILSVLDSTGYRLKQNQRRIAEIFIFNARESLNRNIGNGLIKVLTVAAEQLRKAIVGARTNRYAGPLELLCGIAGRVNIQNGDISDYRHANYQENVTGKAFAFPFGRGSSDAGLVLMEMLRIGTAPGAIINVYTDPVILTGPLICKHFYGQILPVVNVTEEYFEKMVGAKDTGEESTQDVPEEKNIGKIEISDRIIYYYAKNDTQYIEEPYVGIYECSFDVNDFFSELEENK